MSDPAFERGKGAAEIIGDALKEMRDNAALIPSLHDKLDALSERLDLLTERLAALDESLGARKRRSFFGGRD